jgi:rhamnogalacturonyl hydrolase YesR
MTKLFFRMMGLAGALMLVQCQTPQTETGTARITDSNTPLHLLQPDYDTPYVIPSTEEITAVLSRMHAYLDEATPASLVDRETSNEIKDFRSINSGTIFRKGDFRLVSYEWGVTYAGMLLASEATGDPKFADYTFSRMKFLSDIRPYFQKIDREQPEKRVAIYSILHPHALDDAGAMCAAMIKSVQSGLEADLDPMIVNYIDYISTREFRLEDGTLARNRPMRNSVWLDDLFMSVPALAQMGKYSGNPAYFDDAVKQVLQFAQRMFHYEKGLFIHAWIQDMEEHPQFHWARANGWAVMTLVELLEVLPGDYPGRDKVLDLLRRHIRGLANYQSPQGYWHQLIDRNDSFLETSATAIYVYSIAKAVNRGYVDAKVYGPMLCLAWNAVAAKVNAQGQVEGTCVGTGMGFDPAFYYYRPVSPYAAHGYGPVLLAGAEMISLMKNSFPKMNDSAILFYEEEIKTDAPIFGIQ